MRGPLGSYRIGNFLRLADGAAGFNARGAQQARNLLEMQLHRVGAQNLGLREADAGVAHLIHAGFEIGDVLLKVDSLGRHVEAPLVNATAPRN